MSELSVVLSLLLIWAVIAGLEVSHILVTARRVRL